MTLVVDFPECQQSPIGQLDGRWRLGTLLLAGAMCLGLRELAPSALAFLLTVLLVAFARLPFRWVLPRWGTGMLMILLFGIWLPFLPERGDPTTPWLGVALSTPGLRKFAVLLLKTASLLGLLLVVLASAPLYESMHALQTLRVPPLVTNVILLTYRYLHVLAEEFRRIRLALRVRGFKSRANFRTYHTIGQVTGTLLVRSQERSERVAQAMRCRGFDGRFPSLTTFRTRGVDVAFFASIVAIFTGLLVWDVWG